MQRKTTIMINGRLYDAITGLALPDDQQAGMAPASECPVSHRHPVHRRSHHPKPSQALRRDLVHRPIGHHESQLVPDRMIHHNVAKSVLVKKFSPHPYIAHESKSRSTSSDIPPVVAAVHHKFIARSSSNHPHLKSQSALSMREIKETMLAQAVQSARPNTQAPSRRNTPQRISSILVACAAVILLSGYLTYIIMPSISVRIAASQAGIDATYPSYHPDGYRFVGPVAYQDRGVILSFSANGGSQRYILTQSASEWDSKTVFDNLVARQSTPYSIHNTHGLTVFTFRDSNAAWVNRGILYTINGDAPLSTEQVLKIANSL
ncbi:MAG: DUF4367 domain-containing protein [Candidatus Saccharimonadales bacterium]